MSAIKNAVADVLDPPANMIAELRSAANVHLKAGNMPAADRFALAADLVEMHRDTAIELDRWPAAQSFVLQMLESAKVAVAAGGNPYKPSLLIDNLQSAKAGDQVVLVGADWPSELRGSVQTLTQGYPRAEFLNEGSYWDVYYEPDAAGDYSILIIDKEGS